MDKKQRSETLDLFAEAFHEVVVPELEKITNRLTDVEKGVDTLNRKFDAQQTRSDRHDQKFENHEKRIRKLESTAIQV
ncbi:hypothetical protein A2125_00290 [Candidatus Woesebacteria bacterium GWB1_43_5]|uniref:Uncharacterized protein n=1 Tax=Candidatus Woesebacteria bacterium GWB1_43_5 TaxID=1802474 RepID=A0A1F7WRT9_9BACT|nr:MAG: hypothetical protein A2125_00290 [Candidatus Woesebacteria bacterium GWB1_43_5]